MGVSATTARSAEREVLITRLFDAPRELVFDAWTDPRQLAKWFAPHGCEIEFRAFDPRPGGTFHSCIRSPDGHECWCRGVYRTINRPVQIVLTMAVSNARGESVEPASAGMDPDWPTESAVTVTLVEKQGRTMLTLHQTVSESLAKRTGAHPSWLEMLDRLARLMARS
jgi:uncharacterized protein YndB with AHSA1/START domain